MEDGGGIKGSNPQLNVVFLYCRHVTSSSSSPQKQLMDETYERKNRYLYSAPCVGCRAFTHHQQKKDTKRGHTHRQLNKQTNNQEYRNENSQANSKRSCPPCRQRSSRIDRRRRRRRLSRRRRHQRIESTTQSNVSILSTF